MFPLEFRYVIHIWVGFLISTTFVFELGPFFTRRLHATCARLFFLLEMCVPESLFHSPLATRWDWARGALTHVIYFPCRTAARLGPRRPCPWLPKIVSDSLCCTLLDIDAVSDSLFICVLNSQRDQLASVGKPKTLEVAKTLQVH